MIGSRPTPRFAYAHPARFVAFGFGAGLAPSAPGTVGTLAAWPVALVLADLHPGVLLPLIAALFALGVWACGVTAEHLGVQDHGAMVWDEMVAFLLVATLLPQTLGWQVAGFILFRAFDIGKPPPIRWIEGRCRGGFGVMVDDLAAAGYALLVLAVARRVLL